MQSETANSAQKALQILTTNTQFDLVILDYHMPEMDGLQLALEIKKKWPSLPLVMLSSLGHQIKKEDSPFEAYLNKPVRVARLKKTLIQILNNVSACKLELAEIVLDSKQNDASGANLRILLAEDNIVNQKIALRMIEKAGLRADSVANGQEAVDALKNVPYDVILMDMQMPIMNGIEATKLIRKTVSEEYQPVIIALTANDSPEHRQVCIDAGMDDFLAKPIRMNVLQAKLNAITPKKHSHLRKVA